MLNCHVSSFHFFSLLLVLSLGAQEEFGFSFSLRKLSHFCRKGFASAWVQKIKIIIKKSSLQSQNLIYPGKVSPAFFHAVFGDEWLNDSLGCPQDFL